jgi:hypothetical protein
MREIRPYGSEGGGIETNRSFLPLSKSEPRHGNGDRTILCVVITALSTKYQRRSIALKARAVATAAILW